MRFLIERNLTPDEEKQILKVAQRRLDKYGEEGLSNFINGLDKNKDKETDEEKESGRNLRLSGEQDTIAYNTLKKLGIFENHKDWTYDTKALYCKELSSNGNKANKDYLKYLMDATYLPQDKKTIDTIYKLFDNGMISSSNKYFDKQIWFLNNPELYNESPDANLYKLKLLTLVTNEQTKSQIPYLRVDGSERDKADVFTYLTNGGKTIKSMDAMKEIIERRYEKEADKEFDSRVNSWENYFETDAATQKSGRLGIDLLKKEIGLNPGDKIQDVNQVRDYVKQLLPKDGGNLNEIKKQRIDSGALDDELNDLLGKRYNDNIGRDPVEVLKNKILDELEKDVNKSLGH